MNSFLPDKLEGSKKWAKAAFLQNIS